MSGAEGLDEETRLTREAHLRGALNAAADVRELLTRAYEPAEIPPGLVVALNDLRREIWRAQVVNGTAPAAEVAARRIRDSDEGAL